MSRNIKLSLLSLILCLPFGLAAYIATQQPKFSLNRQQFGLMLLKDGYRSYFLSWSDGEDMVTGEHFHIKGTNWHRGCRIIPRFQHLDLRGLEVIDRSRPTRIKDITSTGDTITVTLEVITGEPGPGTISWSEGETADKIP